MKDESFPVTKDQTLCKRYIDDIINQRKKMQIDLLSNDLNNYVQSIILTLEVLRSSDTSFKFQNGIIYLFILANYLNHRKRRHLQFWLRDCIFVTPKTELLNLNPILRLK